MKNLLIKLYDDDHVEHVDGNFNLYPNPLAMIIWKLSSEYERKIQYDENNDDVIEELEELIKSLPEHFDLFGAPVQSIS